MSVFDGLRHRLDVLLHGERYTRETDRELRFHVELATLERLQTADSDIHAEREARRAVGSTTYYREEVRAMTLLLWTDRVLQNVLYAVRGLKRAPGFTAAVVLTLGFGVGVNAAMFSLLDHIFLQPPAGVTRPSELRRLYLDIVNSRVGGRQAWPTMAYPQFKALRAAVDPSIQLGTSSTPDSIMLRDGNARIPARQSRVNTAYFAVTGVRAQAGRLFSADEDNIATPTPVIVISDAFWRSAFHGDQRVLGKHVGIGPVQFTVVGIAQPGFTGVDLDAVDLWTPANMYQGSGGFGGLPWYETFGAGFNVIARPGSPAALDQLLTTGSNAIQPVIMKGFEYDATIRLASGPIIQALGPGARAAELLVATRVAGVALMVLVIACANVTNLLLLRATRRRREIAVRRALGVSRWRLIEQLTIESLVLATIGGCVALAFSFWASAALRHLVLPRAHWSSNAVDLRTVAFTVGVIVLIGLAAGIVPAFQSLRPDLVESLKAGSRDSAYRSSKTQSILLALQAALCLVLLVGAGLFIRSLDNVRSIGVGYNPDNQIIYRPVFDDPRAHDAELRTAIPEAARRLTTIDGVEAVAFSSAGPLQGMSFGGVYLPDRDSLPKLPGEFGPSQVNVSPGFFKASGLPLRAGREFADGDGPGFEQVIIVGASMAALYWPGEPAVGKCLILGNRDDPCRRVVGIAADAHRMGVIEGASSQIYIPIAQTTAVPRVLIVRVRPGRAVAITRATDEILRPLLTNMVDMYSRTVGQILEPQLRPWRLGATLFTALGILALVVAAIGVYSVVAFGVSQRMHEMGIRVALGATRRQILNLVLRSGVEIVAIGIALGAGTSLALGRLVRSLLFGVLPNDASVLIGAASLLCAVGIAACLIPGWRAARVDPATALRAD